MLKGAQEEKSNRIIEVMLSSIRAVQLMRGKIFGIGLAGIVQFSIIIVFSILLFSLVQSIVDINASDLVNDQIQMMNADGELIDAQIPTLTAEEIDTLYAIEGSKSFLPILWLLFLYSSVVSYFMQPLQQLVQLPTQILMHNSIYYP